MSIHLILIIWGICCFSIKLNIVQKIIKYSIPIFYGVFTILLYFTYLAAFFGKNYNSRIFTFEILWGYLKYLNDLITTFSLNSVFVYFIIFFVPLIIFVAFQLMNKLIFQGLQQLKNIKIQEYYTPRIILLCISILVASFLIVKKRWFINDKLLLMEEPIISFISQAPFQGLTILDDNEDDKIRSEYPKNLKFQKKNIVLIVVDALRSDHLSLFGYKRKTSPFLDSLYTTGNLKKVGLSFSVAGASFPGINGILRSKIWSNMGYKNFSLQQLLKDQGYELNFLVSGDHTHFYGLKSFYGKNSDFDYYIDGSETKKYIVNDDRIIFEGLENIKPYHNNPSYFHFHLNSAHFSGIKLAKYEKYQPASSNTKDRDNYTNRYDNGILQADDYLKSIFKILQSKGYLQNSIVVITADHGEALGEREQFGHVKNVYTDQILVPILFYESEKVAYRNTSLATTVDIAPTIIDRLGLPIPKTWEGNSLYSNENRDFTFHQMNEHYAIIYCKGKSKLKYVFNYKTKKEEIYDLNKDLYEKRDLINTLDKPSLNIFRKKMSTFRLNQ
ncbi:sulfatase-like hydrolase/transferase [Emticicia sp. SJ17W-69]|uniref:sulfatase-like hydrolase/transferase n=1 Tax=Emticicia sp. SJ17W-69 TaxID=3421657 RepID=UPI003EBEF145